MQGPMVEDPGAYLWESPGAGQILDQAEISDGTDEAVVPDNGCRRHAAGSSSARRNGRICHYCRIHGEGPGTRGYCGLRWSRVAIQAGAVCRHGVTDRYQSENVEHGA